jgi:hypothetical protein
MTKPSDVSEEFASSIFKFDDGVKQTTNKRKHYVELPMTSDPAEEDGPLYKAPHSSLSSSSLQIPGFVALWSIN